MSLSNGPGRSSSSSSANSLKNYNNSNKVIRHKNLQSKKSHRHRSGDPNKNSRSGDDGTEIIPRTNADRSGGLDNPSYDDYGDIGDHDPDYRSTSRFQNTNLPMPNGHVSSKPRAKIRHKTRGKRFPLTPTPSQSYNIPYDNTPPVILKSPGLKMHENAFTDHPNDMDLIDYEDYGSSTSSTSSGNSSEDDEESDRNIKSQLQGYSPKNNDRNSTNHSSIRNETDYKKFNGSWDRDRGSSLYETPGGLRDNFEENGPCSSSSLREPLNDFGRSSKASNKVSPIGSSNTSTSKRNGSDRTTSLRKSESRTSIIGEGDGGRSGDEGGGESDRKNLSNGEVDTVDNEFDPSNPRYAFSGVGRHFGRKSTVSLLELTDEVPIIEAPKDYCGIDVIGYLTRLKAVSIVFLATLFILSSSSLLFVFPIIIDPILLGMEAQFSIKPVQCRTTNLRNGTGPVECVVPSCRAGCTADLFTCFFIDVEYEIGPQLVTAESYEYLNLSETTNSSYYTTSFNDSTTGLYSQDKSRNGTLLVNINGCGFPPDVNCTEFRKTYGKLNKVFPCFYSQVNESIVVPYYNLQEEKTHLIIGLSVPFGLAFFSAFSLILLLKCRGCACGLSRNRTVAKNSSSLKLLDTSGDDAGGGDVENMGGAHARDHSKLNGVSKASNIHLMNGSVQKTNGHALQLQDTMAGLLGMKQTEMLQESIKTLPKPHLNGSVPNPRKSRYAKNKKFLTRGQSVDDSKLPNNRQDKNGSSEDEL